MTVELADRIDALLPQTQCTRCGYPTCRDYAIAIANGDADINQCPPGGADGVAALAALLGRDGKPLDPRYGVEAPPVVAFIDEDICIGCTKCIQACPVDAIVGAAKRMHTVIADECTGCELCIPPCPVDCISLAPTSDVPLARVGVLARATQARERYVARNARRARATPNSKPPRLKGGDDGNGAGSTSPDTNTIPFPTSSLKAEEKGTPLPGDTQQGSTPITRSAVLEAIARGRARKRGDHP